MIKMREYMTNAFWACVPINFILFRTESVPPLLLVLSVAVGAIYAAFAYKLTKQCI